VIVLAEGGGEALAFGPAHVGASPLPGQPGTSVIGGHRDTHFEFLRHLKVGDEVHLEMPNRNKIRFRITGSVIVNPKSSGISTAGKKPLLALVTCFPFDSVSSVPMRYVVFATEIT
jgi:sortase A